MVGMEAIGRISKRTVNPLMSRGSYHCTQEHLRVVDETKAGVTKVCNASTNSVRKLRGTENSTEKHLTVSIKSNDNRSVHTQGKGKQ